MSFTFADAGFVGSLTPSNFTLVPLTYSAGGDTNDLIYYLGTNSLATTYANPVSTVRWGRLTSKAIGTSPGTPVRNAFDRASSNWHSPDGAADQYLLFDLGTKRSMAPTVLGIQSQNNQNNYPVNWKFQGSNDGGVTWTDLYTSTTVAHTAINQWRTFTISGSDYYQWLRLQQTGVGSFGTNHFITGEIQVWGTLKVSDVSTLTYPPPDTPFGSNGAVRVLAPTATGDSVFNSNAASRAIDNNGGTYFHSNSSSAGWLRLQFGGGIKVRPCEIHIRCRPDANAPPFNSGVLEGSDDASNWTTLTTFPTGAYHDGITGQLIRFSLPMPAVGYTYLRLRATGNYLIVTEIDVYGNAA